MNYFLSIIIPVYNEEFRIKNTLENITNYFSDKNFKYELILVNDGSSDNTVDVIKTFKNKINNNSKNFELLILNNDKNKGKGFSVRKGVLNSKGKFVLFSDADLSTPIEEFEKLYHYLQNGFNIAIGSRALKDSNIIIRQNKVRESMGKLFNLLIRKITNLNYFDTQCGFKCFDRKTVNSIFPYLKINDFSFDIEILYLAEKQGLKIEEVPIRWINSIESKVRIIKDPIIMFQSLGRIKKIHQNSFP